jgi:hypothetical protein
MWKKTTIIRISRKPSPVEMMMGKRITRECEIFQLFV